MVYDLFDVLLYSLHNLLGAISYPQLVIVSIGSVCIQKALGCVPKTAFTSPRPRGGSAKVSGLPDIHLCLKAFC